MRKILNSILFIAGLSLVFASCSNGEYTANPSGNANTSLNPLNPLKSGDDFSWGGNEPLSADINGSHWVAEGASFLLDSGVNYIFANKGASQFHLVLPDVYQGNIYNTGFGKYDRYMLYADSFGGLTSNYYFSYLGNFGQLYITENDSAIIAGKFHFQGINNKGQLISVTNGYFKIVKP